MLLFKYFKNQKKKEPANELNVELAEDALVVQDSGNNVSQTSTLLNVTSVANCERQRVTIGLLRGASDSKVKKKKTTQNLQQTTHSRLYPNLEEVIPRNTQSETEERQKTRLLDVIKENLTKSPIKLDKTIHDVADDITCTLHAKLMSDEQQNLKFKQLLTDITKTVTLISPSIESPNYEYNFDNELDFKKQNSNWIKDAKECHENVFKNPKNSTLESSQNIIIFKRYHQAFRSYKGRNCDVIDCD